MALTARKSHHSYLSGETLNSDSFDDLLELDESDVWGNSYNDVVLPGTHHQKVYNNQLWRPARMPTRKSIDADDRLRVGQKSLPMNIPDWSKILGGEYRPRAVGDSEVGGNDRIPPHEYLARNRVASLSVHEGMGRTLKGRDLRRVRNAIWKKTGFED